ncbi:hypothetical protein Taro_019371 [Colocasia esculenta]|uniref:Uncharacterized protein n=1 Tax=Colocasia esculenta TaxID=4460 RepID=A0A843V595_COLES|nr:hypothetical protein [Colocasia esculenta]
MTLAEAEAAQLLKVWAGYASPFALLVHCFETQRRQAMRFERVGLARCDSSNRLYDACRSDFMWHRFGWTCLKSLNVVFALDVISISVLSASFHPDRAEDTLSGDGEDAVASMVVEIFDDFSFRWLVRRGNHARTMLGAWACHRRGGFGALLGIFC